LCLSQISGKEYDAIEESSEQVVFLSTQQTNIRWPKSVGLLSSFAN